MRRTLLIVPLAGTALLVWWVVSGADVRVAAWTAGWQREFQNALAGALRALRAEPGAVIMLIGLCFGYGLAHAAGPGHGKVLIGGYGIGRRVPVLRLSAIAIAASVGQAVTAITVVGIGIFVLGWTRTQATGVVEGLLAQMSAIAIGAIGLWLVWRGARRLWRAKAPATDRAPHHPRDGTRCGCGHRHAPTLDEVQAATGLRDAAVLIGSIAIRPCSGAVLLLVLTWHTGILAAGVLGTLAMSLGTGAVTVVVAITAVTMRESARLSLGAGHQSVRFVSLAELAAGTAIALLSFRILYPV